ncbi:hypothetical protein SSX86_000951 [Deinandra increscens subsp. villosa]|uniref:Uncharacterized protein n=1 Tax=Deinandra increscens subsp. villosa TaxID=3103831 RepID=A0AAP0DTX3_9ASTR
MASTGEAPPIISPVMAPGSDMRPTVFVLSITGESAITNDRFTCWSVACRGVAPNAKAVSTYAKNKDYEFFYKLICVRISSRSLFIVTPVTVIAFPTIIPATGIIYCGVNGNTFSKTSNNIVNDVPAKIDAPAIYFPCGTCFARWPAVYPATETCEIPIIPFTQIS